MLKHTALAARYVLLKTALAITCGLGLATIAAINVPLLALARQPAGVVLSDFHVAWSPSLSAVEIGWETAVEYNTLGFAVERALTLTGTYSTAISFEPAVGDQVVGAVYGPFFDTEVTTRTTYWYRLVVYDQNLNPDYSVPPIAVFADPYVVYLPTLRRHP